MFKFYVNRRVPSLSSALASTTRASSRASRHETDLSWPFPKKARGTNTSRPKTNHFGNCFRHEQRSIEHGGVTHLCGTVKQHCTALNSLGTPRNTAPGSGTSLCVPERLERRNESLEKTGRVSGGRSRKRRTTWVLRAITDEIRRSESPRSSVIATEKQNLRSER